jgi:hypothetical protein
MQTLLAKKIGVTMVFELIKLFCLFFFSRKQTVFEVRGLIDKFIIRIQTSEVKQRGQSIFWGWGRRVLPFLPGEGKGPRKETQTQTLIFLFPLPLDFGLVNGLPTN